MSQRDYPSHPVATALEAEPTVAPLAAPIGFVIALGLVFFAATMYLDRHGGGFDPQVYAPYASRKAVDDAHPKSADDAAIAKGRRVYDLTCAPCHQANGMGLPGQFPPLAGSDWVQTPGAARMVRIVLNGFQGPVQVKGAEFNNIMVPWRDALKDEEIAAVITYVRRNPAWGNKAAPVKPDQVKKIRDATAGKGGAWTAPELQSVPETE